MDLTPRAPKGSLVWSDEVLDLHDQLAESPLPVYIVGGAVRDALLRYPIRDIDLVTEAGSGIKLARRIANILGGDLYVMDEIRDVARALIETPAGRLNVDVSGFRGADLAEDLVERDFTINAMAVDVRGDLGLLIDPLNGERDLVEKRIRRCLPHSIDSDPIRALRAVRHSVQFSARIEPETVQDIRRLAPQLRSTSPERVRDEFFKLLDLPRPHTALRVAEALGLIDVILPEAAALKALTFNDRDGWSLALTTVERLSQVFLTISPRRTDSTAAVFGLGMLVMALDRFRGQLQHHLEERLVSERSLLSLHMLAALLTHSDSSADSAERTMELLRLSGTEAARLESILALHRHPVFESLPDALAAHRYWHAAGPAGIDAALFMLARVLAEAGPMINQDYWIRLMERVRVLFEAYYERYDTVVSPPPFVDGYALQTEFKLKPGPMIGDLLRVLREAQVTGEVTDRESALAYAQAYLDQDSASSSSR
jgi:tRNA nucleotidyltransferase/poly(A) polymerase